MYYRMIKQYDLTVINVCQHTCNVRVGRASKLSYKQGCPYVLVGKECSATVLSTNRMIG
jgi:hypothetical protein